MTRSRPWIALLAAGAVLGCSAVWAGEVKGATLTFKPVRYEPRALVFKLRGFAPAEVRSARLRAAGYRLRVDLGLLRNGVRRGLLRVRVPARLAASGRRARARLIVRTVRRAAAGKTASGPETVQAVGGGGPVIPPPVSFSTDPVIAAAGDVACDPISPSFNGGAGTATSCRQRYTSDLLVEAGLAAVLTLGDLQYEDGTLANYQLSFDPTWGRVRDILRPAVGNHEYQVASAAGYFDYFNGAGNQLGPAGDRTKGYYSFDIGAWHLISLNSNCSIAGGCGAGSPQELWLKADLAAHPATCTLAYWHHPQFSSGPHGNGGGVNGTDALWQDLYDAGGDLVLSGHDHDYERFAPQTAAGTADPARGIREFVVGTGGKTHYLFSTLRPNSEVRNADTFGVLKLVLHPAGYDWSFVPEAGGAFTDSGSETCHQ
jgi:hypothetical protein